MGLIWYIIESEITSIHHANLSIFIRDAGTRSSPPNLLDKRHLDMQFLRLHVLACNVVNTSRTIVNFFPRKFLSMQVALNLTDYIEKLQPEEPGGSNNALPSMKIDRVSRLVLSSDAFSSKITCSCSSFSLQ